MQVLGRETPPNPAETATVLRSPQFLQRIERFLALGLTAEAEITIPGMETSFDTKAESRFLMLDERSNPTN